MPHHFLTIPAELRLNICKLVLVNTAYTVDVWEQDESFDYFLEDYNATGNSPEAQHITSMLFVCYQIHAEVSTFLHDFVRLHFRSNPFGCVVEMHELDFLILIDCTVLSRASQHVQTLSTPYQLPYRAESDSWGPRELMAMLPRLRTLIVYDANEPEVVRSRIATPWVNSSKQNLISDIERCYYEHQTWYRGLYMLAYGEGRTYTIVHQEFFDEDEICIGKLLPGASNFTYEFLPAHDAIVKLDEKQYKYFDKLKKRGCNPAMTHDAVMQAFNGENSTTKGTEWIRNATSGRLERSPR